MNVDLIAVYGVGDLIPSQGAAKHGTRMGLSNNQTGFPLEHGTGT